MLVVNGKGFKVNRAELLNYLTVPEIEKLFYFFLETVKISHGHLIHSIDKPNVKLEFDYQNSNVISIANMKPVYIDNPDLLRFIEDLMDNEEYQKAVLSEHKEFFKNIYLSTEGKN